MQTFAKAVLLGVSLALSLVVFSANASASTVAFINTDSGWYTNLGNHAPGNTNYLTGDFSNSAGSHFRNYFVFNLASLSGTVTSAQLELWTYGITGSGVYSLYDVSSNAVTLQSTSNSLATYADLGSGLSFGSISLATVDANTLITINLNAAALAAIQASAGGVFAVGGDFIGGGNWAMGGSGLDGRNRLVVNTGAAAQTPEPASLILLGSGCAGVLVRLRRKMRSRNSI